MNLDTTLHLLPRQGPPAPLYIYLHGESAGALAMVQVVDAFAQAYPQAAHLVPDGSSIGESAEEGRQWYSERGITEQVRAERVRGVVPAILDFVRDAQAHFGVTPNATALVGFSQGAIVALEAAQASPGLVGRVVAIAGRYAALPEFAPQAVIHLAHGKDDPVVSARHSVEAATRLIALGGDVTADIVPGIGHLPHPELVARAVGHLQTFLPRRIWAEAMAEAPLLSTRADSRDLARPVLPAAANDNLD